MVLVDRLNEQQWVFPYILTYKLFSSRTFGEFINSCMKAQIDGAVIEALKMVKDDYSDVNVAQSMYENKTDANDLVDNNLVWAMFNPPRFPTLDFLVYCDGLVTLWELLQNEVDVDGTMQG